GPAGRIPAFVHLHFPRPRRGEVHLRPRHGDERRGGGRDGRFRRDLPQPPAGIHAPAPRLDPEGAAARTGARNMTPRSLAALAACLLAAGCAATPPVHLTSGVDPADFDQAVRPQDDLYEHVNGGWMARHPIPPDKAWYGVFIKVRDDTLAELRKIVEGLAADPAAARDEDARKIRDLYASFMDERRLDALGL